MDPGKARMVAALAVTARVLAAAAAILAAIGLWACLAAEARLWGPDVPVPEDRRWLSAPVFSLPHVIGLVAAVVARRSVLCSVSVLVGVAVNTWLSYEAWTKILLTRNGLVLALFQTCILQLVLCALPIGGAVTSWQERRENRSTRASAPGVSSE